MGMRGEIIGMDLGTTAFRVCTKGGLAHEESGAVLSVAENGRLRKIGDKALTGVQGGQENLRLVWPMGSALMTQEKFVDAIVRQLIRTVERPGVIFRPRVRFSVRDAWGVLAHKNLIQAALNAGAREAEVIPASRLVAWAAEREQDASFACLDIGATRSDVVVRRHGQAVQTQALRFGGRLLDRLIVAGLLEERGLWICESTAERLKEEKLANGEVSTQLLILNGRKFADGTPMRLSIESGVLWSWLNPAIDELAEQLVRFVSRLPEGDRVALGQNGLWLAGGTAALYGLGKRLEKGVGLKIHVLPRPEEYALQGFRKKFSKGRFL